MPRAITPKRKPKRRIPLSQPISNTTTKYPNVNPIKSTLTKLKDYPQATIYQTERSQYWWCRVRLDGKYYTRSMKTIDKRLAKEKAKVLFMDLITNEGRREVSDKARSQFANVCKGTIEHLKITTPKVVPNYQSIINRVLIPKFGIRDINSIDYHDLLQFYSWLQEGGLGRNVSEFYKGRKANNQEQPLTESTKRHYIVCLKHVFDYGMRCGVLNRLPNYPKWKRSKEEGIGRDYFTWQEYTSLGRFIKSLYNKDIESNSKNLSVKKFPINREFHILVNFLVNSFLRVGDIKVLKWQHVSILEDKEQKRKKQPYKFLKLTHPATKTTDTPVLTMFSCYEHLEEIKAIRKQNKKDGLAKREYLSANDYIFLPSLNDNDGDYKGKSVKPRDYARVLLTSQFNLVIKLWKEKYPNATTKQNLTLYSLRHSSIMFRLKYGDNVDLYTLAKNCRTSLQMIEKFYGKYFIPEHKRENLQSFRKLGYY